MSLMDVDPYIESCYVCHREGHQDDMFDYETVVGPGVSGRSICKVCKLIHDLTEEARITDTDVATDIIGKALHELQIQNTGNDDSQGFDPTDYGGENPENHPSSLARLLRLHPWHDAVEPQAAAEPQPQAATGVLDESSDLNRLRYESNQIE